jgi:hypothetical protein
MDAIRAPLDWLRAISVSRDLGAGEELDALDVAAVECHGMARDREVEAARDLANREEGR